MKKNLFHLLFIATFVVMPLLSFTSCEDEKPADEFEDLYGYWINADYSGAMKITPRRVAGTQTECYVEYFLYTSKGVESIETYYIGGDDIFGVIVPGGGYKGFYVRILYKSQNCLVLEKSSNKNTTLELSSYTFSRVTESEFNNYLKGENVLERHL